LSRDRDALLERIMATGDRRRRRATAALGGGVLAVVALIGSIALLRDDDPRDVVAVSDETTTTTTEPEDEVIPEIDKVEPETTTTSTTDPETDPTTATSEPLVCLNSYDERCGAFSWTSEPTNEPLLLEVTASATEVAVGEEVVLHIVASDADAQPHIQLRGDSCASASVTWGDGGPGFKCSPAPCQEPDRHGPWEPPPPDPGTDELDAPYRYDAAGVYEVVVGVRSGPLFDPCGAGATLYNSYATQTLTITVVDPDPRPEPELPGD
jgi:hypothetical protein